MIQQNYQQYVLEAIETVISNWDLDDEYLADAIQSQAELLACSELDSFDTDYASF